MALGLDYMHASGHLHLDLSSNNVLMQTTINARGFTCKISDMVRMWASGFTAEWTPAPRGGVSKRRNTLPLPSCVASSCPTDPSTAIDPSSIGSGPQVFTSLPSLYGSMMPLVFNPHPSQGLSRVLATMDSKIETNTFGTVGLTDIGPGC